MTTRQRHLRGHAVYPSKASRYHRWTAPTCRCGCGRAVPQRGRYRCYCDCVLDRDLNASLNVLARGLASMGLYP